MTLLSEALKPELEEELWLLKSDLCRCCHVEGSFNDLNFQFFSDILKESLNINLSPIDGILMNATSKICDKCIQKVLDVNTFRAQVLACEERFHNLCAKNLIKVTPLLPEVKIEDDEAAETRLKSENGDDDWPSDDALPCNNSKDEEPLEEKPTKAELRKAMSTRAKAKAKGDKARKAKAKPPEARAKPPEARKKARDNEHIWTKEDYVMEGNTFICSRCELRCYSSRTIRRHICNEHFKIYEHQCTHCEQRFKLLSQKRHHLKVKHGVDASVTCGACQKTFVDDKWYKEHMKVHHKLGETMKCDKCDYETQTDFYMKRHMIVHETEKKYQCSYCKKFYKTPSNLRIHTRIHTRSKMKECKECGAKFVQRTSLKYHMTTHHPEVPF